MERITLARGVRSWSGPPSLRVTIRARCPGVLVALLVGVLTSWAFLLPGLMRIPRTTVLGDVGLTAYIALGVVLFSRVAWFLGGWETFDLSPGAVSVRRSIGPFALRRTYRFGDLNDASFFGPGDSNLPSWKRLYLETGREAIVLDYRHRMVRLTRNLDKAEGAYLLTAIRLWMQDRGGPERA